MGHREAATFRAERPGAAEGNSGNDFAAGNVPHSVGHIIVPARQETTVGTEKVNLNGRRPNARQAGGFTIISSLTDADFTSLCGSSIELQARIKVPGAFHTLPVFIPGTDQGPLFYCSQVG